MVPNAAATATADDEGGSRRRNKLQMQQVALRKRKWVMQDTMSVVVFGSGHIGMLFAPFNFTWGALRVAVVLYLMTSLFGVTLSFHRNLSHRSFKLPKWLEYFFAYCGVLAVQRDPIFWVSTHRYHHQFTDTDRDPHSPNEGFWFSHFAWMFDESYLNEKSGGYNNVMDLQKQAYYRFLQRTYHFHLLGLGILLYVVGGFPYIVWGMFVRTTVFHHVTFMVNSVCHTWGQKPWNTKDLSTNNWLMGLLALGEGWHNNHHAFESSARHGLEWWQIDMTWYVVKLLEYAGLATDVKLPSEIQKLRMSTSK